MPKLLFAPYIDAQVLSLDLLAQSGDHSRTREKCSRNRNLLPGIHPFSGRTISSEAVARFPVRWTRYCPRTFRLEPATCG